MTEKLELSILRNLLCNEEYFRKVVPFIKGEYFQELSERVLFEEIQDFSNKYDKYPTKEVLIINLNQRNDLTEETHTQCVSSLGEMSEDYIETKWLVDTTEKWCQERAVYNALLESIKIAEGGGDKEVSKDAIPSILQNALAVSFDEHIGHDYIEQVTDRYDYYHLEENKIPFDIEKLNVITKGGLPNKSLNIALAGTGVGKSLFMCHMAASCLSIGFNVLYITLEMAEEKIAERIDANLLNVNIKDIATMPQTIFENRVNEIGRKSQGKLIIKEYPTASAHSGHFKSLLSDLALKKDFRPQIIFIDYLNICASSRYKGHIVNSYTYVKAIAEELRGLAVEHDLPIVSATQTTRSGFGNSDVDLTDTSESFGLPATADLMLALISTEELEKSGRIIVKQLKNRYNDLTYYRRFTVGIDRSKMKLYNVDDADGDITSDAPEEETFDRLEDISDRQSRLDKFSQFVI
ncbi:DNA primase-helicase subunit [Synechococcus phage S-CAM1]|jgi:replicative DNA helicase|uniref:DnaB-like replicative helicase n=1 Tax=Synechococcus phage S-CAM1 TaxID=754037 RepID=M4QHI0_9CAUD|nr:DNA primase-helicase subunit [Synechococcus phage S-CAM1]AGH26891.1 DNA primase-helicase subunit [Synechococcus phage S-CAM1]AOV57434.1 DNA primase/helicase [Synechococcus phage S-CAM1]AOV57684.1 DNA primase/helicase [Synechococcus phage S-CAM1]AOV57934.1 DNA primase/helicase [Synechococcus phage S-CAM1]AOV58184.1 DNA primase/helicase [Synechococcus phage S-CAM1]